MGKTTFLINMQKQRRAAADAARQRARDQMSAGIGTIMGGIGGAVGKGMTGGQGNFMQNLQQTPEDFGQDQFSWNLKREQANYPNSWQ